MSKQIGKCLCESVVYEIVGDLGPVFNCHCSKCRRWHGAAFRTRASIETSQLVWIKGESNISAFHSSNNVTKHFCSSCGSPLHSSYSDNPSILGIPLGGIEGLSDVSPEANIFTDSKATWYDITDDIPAFEQWPGSELKVRETKK